MDAVQSLGCIVCRRELYIHSPAEIHHTDGKTRPGAHMRVLPLCYRHHREGANSDSSVSRHPYRVEFEARYGTETELLDEVALLLEQNNSRGWVTI